MIHSTDIHQKYHRLYRQILQAHRRFFVGKIVSRIIRLLLAAFVPVALFILINLLFNVADLIRQIFLVGLLGWLLLFFLLRIVPILRELFSPSGDEIYSTAKRAGLSDPSVQDTLLDYIQIYQDRGSTGTAVLKNMALEQLYGRFSNLSFKQAGHYGGIWKKARLFLMGLAAFFALFLFFPQPVGIAAKKVLFPWQNFKEPLPIKLVNRSGDVTVLKNDPVVLRGTFKGVTPERLYLMIEDTVTQQNPSHKTKPEKVSITVPSTGEFAYRLNHVRNPFTYYFLAEINQPRFRNRPAVSASGRVQVRKRPMVRNLQVKITPPSYTRSAPSLLSPNDGEITALRGSGINLRIEADKQLSAAHILFSDSTKLSMNVSGHTANAEFKVSKNVNYSIHIFDADSIRNFQPVEYGIYPLSDEYPFAQIKQPGENMDIEDELQVPLFVEMRDDYGFSGLRLKGSVIRQGSSGDTGQVHIKLPYREIEDGKAFSESVWDLTSLYLVPDDYIQYYVEVWDNDMVRGPKHYKTDLYTIRFPSLIDIMARAEEKQEQQLEKVRDVAGESEELKKKLEEISRELKKESEINWERKQEIKEQLEKQRDAMEKLSEIQKELDDVVQKLDRNKMLSPETMEKYMELQKMFEELASPELKEAMEKLQKALEQADPNEIRKAMENLQFSVEEFERNIDRTYELFKRVRLEQKMDELVKLAQKITQEQEQVNKKLEDEKISAEDMKRLDEKEENLRNETDHLKKKIDQTNEEYQKLMKEFSEMLEKSKNFIEEEKLSEMMKQMQQQMSEQNQEQASKTGKQLQSKMQMLQSMLQMARQNMQMQQKQELAEEMQKTLQDMLATSFEQENLANRSKQLTAASSHIKQVARKQSQLRESTNQVVKQLIDISRKTFFLSPKMSQIMSRVLSEMGKSINQLENRNPGQASRSQFQAMAGFNQAILSLQNSMQQMSGGSSASGFQEFMQQLQQMAGQQGQLNKQTMGLFQKSQQGRLQLSSDDLARLAAQQEMIRQNAEQLSEQMGNRQDVMGRLGELGEEMDKVIKDLKKQQLDQDVIERQERILSRLLDAQRSIREKEYSKKREAEREEKKIVKSPPELRKELLQKEDRLRKELMEALREGYTPEYRELIKMYFEALSRESGDLQEHE